MIQHGETNSCMDGQVNKLNNTVKKDAKKAPSSRSGRFGPGQSPLGPPSNLQSLPPKNWQRMGHGWDVLLNPLNSKPF